MIRAVRLTLILANGVSFVSFFSDDEKATEVLEQVEPHIAGWSLAWVDYDEDVN